MYTYLQEEKGITDFGPYQVDIKDKLGPAIPYKWMENYNDWLDEKLEDGLLDKSNKRKKRKIITLVVCLPFLCRGHSKKCVYIVTPETQSNE